MIIFLICLNRLLPVSNKQRVFCETGHGISHVLLLQATGFRVLLGRFRKSTNIITRNTIENWRYVSASWVITRPCIDTATGITYITASRRTFLLLNQTYIINVYVQIYHKVQYTFPPTLHEDKVQYGIGKGHVNKISGLSSRKIWHREHNVLALLKLIGKCSA